MAKIISIEFTDAQWKLIEEHFPNYENDENGNPHHKDITEDELKNVIIEKIRFDVEACIKDTAIRTATASVESCFDV